MNNGLFTSTTCEWETPLSFFRLLDEQYHFTLDVCATSSNAKCKVYFTQEQNGLMQEWYGRCWMNPPYGREIGKWVKKAYESVAGGGAILFAACFLRVPIRRGGTITLCVERSPLYAAD